MIFPNSPVIWLLHACITLKFTTYLITCLFFIIFLLLPFKRILGNMFWFSPKQKQTKKLPCWIIAFIMAVESDKTITLDLCKLQHYNNINSVKPALWSTCFIHFVSQMEKCNYLWSLLCYISRQQTQNVLMWWHMIKEEKRVGEERNKEVQL